jgi:hypothetical protein
MSDKITFGMTQKIRTIAGYDDAVNYNSTAYRYGSYAGQVVNIGLMVANPVGLAGLVARGISVAGMASGGIDAVQAAFAGDFSGAAMMVLNVGLSYVGARGAPCSRMTELAKQTQYGLHVYGMVKNAESAVDKLLAGDLVGAALDATEVGVNAWRFMQSCFAPGTKLLTLRGWVPIEKIVIGDYVWSKPEDDPTAAGEWKRVEELFVRSAPTLVVLVGGRTITTTAEHPIYVRAKGWAPAGLLEAGDLVVGKDGEWTAVEEVERTRRVETVYNLRVADYHTYFVGGESWGFSVWAHNAACQPIQGRPNMAITGTIRLAQILRRTWKGYTAKVMFAGIRGW